MYALDTLWKSPTHIYIWPCPSLFVTTTGNLGALDLENFCTLTPERTSFWEGSSDKDFFLKLPLQKSTAAHPNDQKIAESTSFCVFSDNFRPKSQKYQNQGFHGFWSFWIVRKTFANFWKISEYAKVPHPLQKAGFPGFSDNRRSILETFAL